MSVHSSSNASVKVAQGYLLRSGHRYRVKPRADQRHANGREKNPSGATAHQLTQFLDSCLLRVRDQKVQRGSSSTAEVLASEIPSIYELDPFTRNISDDYDRCWFGCSEPVEESHVTPRRAPSQASKRFLASLRRWPHLGDVGASTTSGALSTGLRRTRLRFTTISAEGSLRVPGFFVALSWWVPELVICETRASERFNPVPMRSTCLRRNSRSSADLMYLSVTLPLLWAIPLVQQTARRALFFTPGASETTEGMNAGDAEWLAAACGKETLSWPSTFGKLLDHVLNWGTEVNLPSGGFRFGLVD
jgi:hypothetical protein